MTFLEREEDSPASEGDSPVVEILESVGAMLRAGDPADVSASMTSATARLLAADGVRVIHRPVG